MSTNVEQVRKLLGEIEEIARQKRKEALVANKYTVRVMETVKRRLEAL